MEKKNPSGCYQSQSLHLSAPKNIALNNWNPNFIQNNHVTSLIIKHIRPKLALKISTLIGIQRWRTRKAMFKCLRKRVKKPRKDVEYYYFFAFEISQLGVLIHEM